VKLWSYSYLDLNTLTLICTDKHITYTVKDGVAVVKFDTPGSKVWSVWSDSHMLIQEEMWPFSKWPFSELAIFVSGFNKLLVNIQESYITATLKILTVFRKTYPDWFAAPFSGKQSNIQSSSNRPFAQSHANISLE